MNSFSWAIMCCMENIVVVDEGKENEIIPVCAKPKAVDIFMRS